MQRIILKGTKGSTQIDTTVPKEEKPEKEVAITKEDDYIYRDLENRMKNIFGSKVEIRRQANDKGKIEIEYYSQEDLDRIIELIGTIG